MHVFLVEILGEQLDVATTTVDVLFMFNCELDDKVFALVAEGVFKFGRQTIESGILASLDT